MRARKSSEEGSGRKSWQEGNKVVFLALEVDFLILLVLCCLQGAMSCLN
jgi:hypothetical protein